MEYQYTINDIKAEVNVSLQSLYTLIKKNQELIKTNSTRKQRKIYYNQTAMDFFKSYYKDEPSLSGNEEEGQNKPNEEEEQNNADFRSDEEEGRKAQTNALNAEIDALHAEIATLKKQLEMKEAERLELLRQNGALILTLQQTQQEKMLLLPPPKKSFSEKVKSIFKGKPQEK